MVKAKPKRKPLAIDSIELRRWCIEEAIHWPVEREWGSPQGYQSYRPATKADVIGRAKKIFEWVTAG